MTKNQNFYITILLLGFLGPGKFNSKNLEIFKLKTRASRLENLCICESGHREGFSLIRWVFKVF